MNATRAAFSHCVSQVRAHDYHHYLCLLELPPGGARRAAFALRAFNIETARAMDVASSDPKIALARLLWWRDALDKIYSQNAPDHPTARALSEVVKEAKISRSWLRRSVEARIADAGREQSDLPKTIADLERYCEDTSSTMIYATLESCGIRSAAADHAATHIGKAGGLLLLIRSLPYHDSKNRLQFYVPSEMTKKHGVSREGLCEVVFEMASVARAHLEMARGLAGTVPEEAKPVLLPGVAAQVMLDGLSKTGYDVFDPRLSRGVLGLPPSWFMMKLKWHSWRGKY